MGIESETVKWIREHVPGVTADSRYVWQILSGEARHRANFDIELVTRERLAESLSRQAGESSINGRVTWRERQLSYPSPESLQIIAVWIPSATQQGESQRGE